MARVLLVEDDSCLSELLCKQLTRANIYVRCCDSADKALVVLEGEDFDAVVTDLHMEGMNGLQFCECISANHPEIAVIVITAHANVQNAIAALRAGAKDFVPKPIHVEELIAVIHRIKQHQSTQSQLRRLQCSPPMAECFDTLIGTSPPVLKLFQLLERVATLESSVLITGESGTGKDLIARALHRQSHRKLGPFIPVNCAALPEPLLEGELFGCVRGAFTDAKTDRLGLFREAHNGTIFLDEIGELPLQLQPKLLRTLQDRTIRPIGGSHEVPCDFRVIAATNRKLETLVKEGQFREDLFYRLNVIQVAVPALRDCGGDILIHAQRYVEECAVALNKNVVGFSDEVAHRFMGYNWPGNFRELRNCIEYAVALTNYERIIVEDLPERIRNHVLQEVYIPNEKPNHLVSLEETKHRYIEHVLDVVQGNKTMAAKILQVNRRTLSRHPRYNRSSKNPE